MGKDGRPRTTPDLSGVIMCGGTPTPGDLAIIQEFKAALSQPTDHLTNLALIEMQAADGDADSAAALERHAARCCAKCERHVMPHQGCILR